MFTENFFNSPLETQEERDIQTCSVHHGDSDVDVDLIGMEAKNFTNYLIYINIYMIVLILAYFFFFNTELKRSKVKLFSLIYFHMFTFLFQGK